MKQIGLALLSWMVLALPTASRAQVKVLMSGGFAAPYQELLPEFQKSTGISGDHGEGSVAGERG